ncbi:hypothetical protein [Paenibacillus polymyxa]|uniref:hypothetical protein n=1 Tax=Paenibacillus polymyxa TaxID=1406 RepID=UPI00046EFDE2|nr:hypothetical protein [Paenibacillus polymyxa]
MQDKDRINTALSFFIAHEKETLEGMKILWSEYFGYYYLICKKQAMGEKSFYKELQNDSRSTDDYIFQNLMYWNRLSEFEDMEMAMYIDPAIKAGKKNDYSDISIIGQQRKT